MACTHIQNKAATLSPPRLSQQVHKEECTLCFDDQDSSEGILVCLECFNGGCLGQDRHHAQLHFERSGHPLGMVIKRTRKPGKERDDQPPPLKKLAISIPTDEEKYDYTTSYKCYLCPSGSSDYESVPALDHIKTGILKAASSGKQSEIKAWEEEIQACEHALMIEQRPVAQGYQVSPHCAQCELTQNLWLCLTCGQVSCGRKQFGGIGGNGHALDHYKQTGHGVGVKLGTITPEGGGDVYCYTCDDSKIDPELPTHLKHFGMDVVSLTKTDKSMTELQLEHNLKFDFSMTGDDGKELEPVFGPGLTGLKNLGNSCYMASVVQALFSLPSFQKRYPASNSHPRTCPVTLPADCLDCQMLKLSDGLRSGRYSHPYTAEGSQFQAGIKPSMFKALIGKGHEEFSTMRQQDSEEFLQHLIKSLRQESKRKGFDETEEATESFKFGMEQKLVCTECHGVRYKVDTVDSISLAVPVREKPAPAVVVGAGDGGSAAPTTKQYEPVPFQSCLEMATGVESLDYACPQCKKNVVAQKSTKFKSFPDVLVFRMNKFQLLNWVPTKLDVPVLVEDELAMESYVSEGKQPGEVELAETDDAAAVPQFDPAAMASLQEMGFPELRCQKALLATGNNGMDEAMNWLFAHMEDPDIDDPLPSAAPANLTAAALEPPAEQVDMLCMISGATPAMAKKALRETNNDPDRAFAWLESHPDDNGEDAEMAGPGPSSETPKYGGSSELPANYRLKAFISHKGPSVHSGHYVATIRQEDGSWVLFNDEKVVKAEQEGNETMKNLAYLYIYQRV